MPSTAFADALPFVLRWEGGYVNHPDDPGGATNRGVTQKTYDDWRSKQGLTTADVRSLTEGEMQAIYESGYWLPPKCDVLPSPLNLVQFDTAVNMGSDRAVKFLQQAVGAVPVDGRFGPGTERCVAGCNTGDVLATYCDAREAYYRDLASRNPKLEIFLKGWMNRLNALRKHVGLPGFEAASDEVDYGDANYMARVPDEEFGAER